MWLGFWAFKRVLGFGCCKRRRSPWLPSPEQARCCVSSQKQTRRTKVCAFTLWIDAPSAAKGTGVSELSTTRGASLSLGASLSSRDPLEPSGCPRAKGKAGPRLRSACACKVRCGVGGLQRLKPLWFLGFVRHRLRCLTHLLRWLPFSLLFVGAPCLFGKEAHCALCCRKYLPACPHRCHSFPVRKRPVPCSH